MGDSDPRGFSRSRPQVDVSPKEAATDGLRGTRERFSGCMSSHEPHFCREPVLDRRVFFSNGL